MPDRTELLHTLIQRAGRTYSEQAGITLRDKPAPLYQLLVLATLLAKPISADIAVAAFRELRAAKMVTPTRMLAATWQQRVDALGRAHYRRYDESTATRLAQGAEFVRDRYGGDLRRLADESGGRTETARRLLTKVPGIGPAGADIFLREVQRVWPWVRPYFGERAVQGARQLHLPSSAAGLRALADDDATDRLAAALVRVSIDRHLADGLRKGTQRTP